MRRLDDFRCPCGIVEEHFIDLESEGPPVCNKCGLKMKRVQSPIRFKLEGLSGDYPTAADKWVKQREEKLKLEKREQERHGEPS